MKRLAATLLAVAALVGVSAAGAEAAPKDAKANHWTWTG